MIDQLPAMAGGGVLSTVILGVLAWLTRKSWHASQRQDVAAADAGTDVIGILRDEVSRLSARLTNLEARCDRQARRIWQLEAELARHGMAVPPESA